jgi:hypothetical protein
MAATAVTAARLTRAGPSTGRTNLFSTITDVTALTIIAGITSGVTRSGGSVVRIASGITGRISTDSNLGPINAVAAVITIRTAGVAIATGIIKTGDASGSLASARIGRTSSR